MRKLSDMLDVITGLGTAENGHALRIASLVDQIERLTQTLALERTRHADVRQKLGDAEKEMAEVLLDRSGRHPKAVAK